MYAGKNKTSFTFVKGGAALGEGQNPSLLHQWAEYSIHCSHLGKMTFEADMVKSNLTHSQPQYSKALNSLD